VKRLLIIALLCLLPPFVVAEEKSAPKKADPLIEAAKEAKAKRKKPSTKVITNKDVKKSKGKLIVIDSKEPETTEKKSAGPAKSSLEKHDERYKARVEAEEHLAESAKSVAELQKELEMIEQRYYEANDPNYRDTVLQERFAQAKRQLEDARAELADARDELQKLEAPQP
jgi:hypothetical protein